MPEPDKLDCIIIGAGAAGIAAAVALYEGNRDFLVVEARDRLGGRTWSKSSSDGSAIEMGGQAIHGTRQVTWEYVLRTGVSTHGGISPEQSAGVVWDSNQWRSDEDPPDMAAVWMRIDETWKTPSGETTTAIQALHDEPFTDRQKAIVRSNLDYFFSDHVGTVSARSAADILHAVRPARGAYYWIMEGYTELWRRLCKPFSGNIVTESPVDLVEYSDEGVVVKSGNQQWRARTAIITLPPSVLQSGGVVFSPGLPAEKLAAINAITMKQTGKISVEFRTPFWQKHVGEAVRFRLQDSPFNWFTTFYAERPGPPVLTSSPNAQLWRDTQGRESLIRERVTDDLQALFPAADVTNEIVALHIADWSSDPYALGRTSIALMGGEKYRAELARPTPPLFWAGEATRLDDTARTVHGAVLSGKNAAIEVFHCLKPWKVTGQATIDWSAYPD